MILIKYKTMKTTKDIYYCDCCANETKNPITIKQNGKKSYHCCDECKCLVIDDNYLKTPHF